MIPDESSMQSKKYRKIRHVCARVKAAEPAAPVNQALVEAAVQIFTQGLRTGLLEALPPTPQALNPVASLPLRPAVVSARSHSPCDSATYSFSGFFLPNSIRCWTTA